MAMHSVEVFIIVDSDGNYAVGHDEESVGTAYTNDVSEDPGTSRRLVKITVNVPVPEPLEIDVDVPEPDEEEATVTVK